MHYRRTRIRKVAALCLSIGLFTSAIPFFALPASANSGTVNTQTQVKKFKEGEILVKFKSGRSVQSLNQIKVIHNLIEKKNFPHSRAKLLSFNPRSSIDQVIKDLIDSGAVEYAEPNYKRSFAAVTEQGYGQQWGMKNTGQSISGVTGTSGIDIGAEQAWSKTMGSNSVVVGVIDSGVDITHSDLRNQIWKNPGEVPGDGLDNDHNGYVDDVNGWDFLDENNSVYDTFAEDAHGTHVAGIIAASKNNTGVIGVAPNVKIMPLKFMGEGGYVSDELEAIEYAKAKGVKIMNMSLGGEDYSKAEYDAIKNTNALFVVAAGNESRNIDGYFSSYPAAYDLANIISVAAVDNKGAFPSWSNYGTTHTDLAAPGVQIVSTMPGDKYAFLSGTSMAAPFVSGTAALYLSKNTAASVLQIKDTLLNTTTPVSSLQWRVKTGGMVNAGKALNGGSSSSSTFTDLQSVPWAQEAIEAMGAKGIINGVGDNRFDPGSNVTRAQFAKLIVKTLGITGTATEPFSDVKSTDWFANDVALAYKYGIINGVSSTQFAPNRSITRQEMAVMMVRAIKYKQSVSPIDVNGTLSKYTDRNQIDSWAKDAVVIAIEQGLMNGMTETTFSPKTNATRAQSAVIMYRFYKKFME